MKKEILFKAKGKNYVCNIHINDKSSETNLERVNNIGIHWIFKFQLLLHLRRNETNKFKKKKKISLAYRNRLHS